jgi:ankyrin repeat protein
MRRLLDAGVPAHDGTFDYDDSCPVFTAAQFGSLRLLEMLLDAPGGADAARAQGPRLGKTALLCAALRSDARPCVRRRLRMLLDKGADASAADTQGRTPAYWAIFRLDVQALDLLLTAATPPADPSSADKGGMTLMMHAASTVGRTAGFTSGLDCLMLLLRCGADARPVQPCWRTFGGYSAADYLLLNCFENPGKPAFRRALTELIRAGAPIHSTNAEYAMTHLMPSVLRATERGVRARQARRFGRRRVAMETEEMVGLAFDFKELWAEEAGVREREARVRELEAELAALGAGETTAEEEDDEEDEDAGEPMQTDEEEDAKRGDQDMEEEPKKE